MVLPCTSVIVIIVLLNVAFTCATPEAMFLRSRLRTRVASLPIQNPFADRSPWLRRSQTVLLHALFLLAGDSLCRAFAGPGIGVGALAAHRQAAAVTQAAITAEIHQPLDVRRDLAAEVAFDDVVAVDDFAQLQYVLVAQLRHPARFGDRDLIEDFVGLGAANSIDVLQRNHDALVGRQIDASDASHVSYSLRRAAPGKSLGVRRCPSVPMSPEEGHKRKQPTPACRRGLASLLDLRLDIPGLLMDSQRFRQPRLAISCTDSIVNGGGRTWLCGPGGRHWPDRPVWGSRDRVLRTFFL